MPFTRLSGAPLVAFIVTAIWLAPAAADVSVGSTVGGFVHVKGQVTGALPDQAPAGKDEKSPALFGELVATGGSSSATIGFIDHSHLLLSQNASITIDALVFNPKTGMEEAVYTLTQGAARLISGAIKGDSLRINTPTATLVVRGTNLKLKVDPAGNTLVSVNSGEVEVSARSGGEKVRLTAGQNLRVGRDGAGDVGEGEAAVDEANIDDPSLDGEPSLPEADLAELGFSEEAIAEINDALDEAADESETDADEGESGETDADADSDGSDSDGGGDGGGGDGGGGGGD